MNNRIWCPHCDEYMISDPDATPLAAAERAVIDAAIERHMSLAVGWPMVDLATEKLTEATAELRRLRAGSEP